MYTDIPRSAIYESVHQNKRLKMLLSKSGNILLSCVCHLKCLVGEKCSEMRTCEALSLVSTERQWLYQPDFIFWGKGCIVTNVNVSSVWLHTFHVQWQLSQSSSQSQLQLLMGSRIEALISIRLNESEFFLNIHHVSYIFAFASVQCEWALQVEGDAW